VTCSNASSGHHSAAFTLDIYAHVLPGMQQGAAERISTLVFGPARPPTDPGTAGS
jgi:hypothetical protein